MTWEERVARLARQAAAFNDVGLDYRLVEVSAADLARLIEERTQAFTTIRLGQFGASSDQLEVRFHLPDPVPCANCDPARMEANVAAAEARMGGPLYREHTPSQRKTLDRIPSPEELQQATNMQRWEAARAQREEARNERESDWAPET